MKSDAERKRELLEREAYLQSRLSDIATELDEHKSPDFEEAATEREFDEVLEDLGKTGSNELRMIGAALVRIAGGEYGYCVVCGERIAEQRLDLIPATPFCARHASDH